jgi:hypothetical protein
LFELCFGDRENPNESIYAGRPDLKLKFEKRAALLGAKIKWPYIANQYQTLPRAF